MVKGHLGFFALWGVLIPSVLRFIVYPVGALLVSAQGKHKACPYKLNPIIKIAFGMICLVNPILLLCDEADTPIPTLTI